MPDVILVNELDEELGTMEKMAAHEQGILHRAFSVFIFDNLGKMLLQQRSENKYHNAGLWSNACCSHPLPGEETYTAAKRRLQEELGFTTELEKAFDFIYEVEFINGLSEHEFDHVFVGYHDGEINADPEEVQEYVYVEMPDIRKKLADNPQHYTEWFKLAFPKIEEHWKRRFNS